MRPDQWLYNTTILSKQQKESLYSLDYECRRLREFGIADSDLIDATFRARVVGGGTAAALRFVQEKAARRITHGNPCILAAVGVEGVMRALEAHRLLMFRWRATEIPGLGLQDVLEQTSLLYRRFGQMPSESDVVWGAFNGALLRPENALQRDVLYFAMAYHLACSGRSYVEVMKEGWRTRARQWADTGIQRVTVLLDGPGTCPVARRCSKKQYRTENVIADPPIPNVECRGEPLVDGGPPWCSCCLTTVWEE